MLVAHKLMANYGAQFPRHYFYYLAAFFAFAIHGIWGPIATRATLASLGVATDTVEAAASVLPLLALPVLFVSWLMLLPTASSLFGVALKPIWIPLHVALFLALIAAAWLAVDAAQIAADRLPRNVLRVEVALALVLEACYLARFVVLAVRFPEQSARRRSVLLRFTALLCAGFVLRSFTLPFAFSFPWMLGAVPLYFVSNLPALLYVARSADALFAPVKVEVTDEAGMERLFEQHQITKRERQIVREICSGKTNREIAATLFISLQTVKDHTHRIYSKLGVGSRLQLVQKITATRRG
jgi:DNA-binding CsgD family transcriptional regulator